MPVHSLKVPDLWFDAIARITPGITFWLVIDKYHDLYLLDSSGTAVIAVAFIGYATGLVSGSFASLIAKHIEERYFNEKMVDSVRARLGRQSHQSRVLSKTHGETVAFLNFTILSCVFASSIACASNYVTGSWHGDVAAALLFATVCFLASLSSAYRRQERAQKYMRDKREESIPAIEE